LHGVTRPVTLALDVNGFTRDPYGGTRAGFSATTELDRRDFGISTNIPMDGGGVVIGDRIQVFLEMKPSSTHSGQLLALTANLQEQDASRFPVGPGPTVCEPQALPGQGGPTAQAVGRDQDIEVMAMPTEPRVADNPQASRYELWLGTTRAGLIQYRAGPGAILLVHTEIDPAFKGQGLGERLVAAALEDLRARGLKLVPLCPFVRAYLRRHPDQADLVAGDPDAPQ
jgi:uncharacterized protein